MKTKAFTILEILLATILAGILVLGTAGVLNKMMTQSTSFNVRIDNDMAWIEASRHLAQMVRASSYLEVSTSDPNTLTLCKYNKEPMGRYVNFPDAVHPGNGYLEYQVYDAATKTYAKQGAAFNHVSATFSRPSAGPKGKGWKNDQMIEVVVTYSPPLVGTMRLRCAVDVQGTASGTGWALVIGGLKHDYPWHIIQTSDGGYVVTGWTASFGAGGNDIYTIKISNDGKVLWSKTYGTNSEEKSFFIAETFADKGVSDGFILIASPYITVIRIDTDGNPVWQRTYTYPGFTTFVPYSILPIFDKRKGQPQGYILAGMAMGGGNSNAVVSCLNTDGTTNWVRYITYKNPSHKGIMNEGARYAKQVFDAAGNADGYIVAGETNKYYDGDNTHDSVLVVRLTETPAYQWSYIYPRITYTNRALYADRVYTPIGAPDGFLISGNVDESTFQLDPFLLRVNENGSKTGRWSLVFSNHGGDSGDDWGGAWQAQTSCTLSAATTSSYHPYIINVSNAGVPSTPLSFDFTIKTPTATLTTAMTKARLESYSKEVFDGYILLGPLYVTDKVAMGMNWNCFYIIKTKPDGSAPENVTYITDAPTNNPVTYTATSGSPITIDIYNNSNNHIDSL